MLREALRLVDEEGLAALTMRRLASRLGVEAMSLYNHVAGKEELREGIAELLWGEVAEASELTPDWGRAARSLAARMRQLAHDHPHAFSLLVSARIVPVPALRLFAAQLDILRGAGFAEPRAVQALNAVLAYATGYAMVELSRRSISRSDGATESEPGPPALVAPTWRLPPETAADLVEVARAVCGCDWDRQFKLGLDALLAGLEHRSRRGDR